MRHKVISGLAALALVMAPAAAGAQNRPDRAANANAFKGLIIALNAVIFASTAYFVIEDLLEDEDNPPVSG